jgi:hypothetical protein
LNKSGELWRACPSIIETDEFEGGAIAAAVYIPAGPRFEQKLFGNGVISYPAHGSSLPWLVRRLTQVAEKRASRTVGDHLSE